MWKRHELGKAFFSFKMFLTSLLKLFQTRLEPEKGQTRSQKSCSDWILFSRALFSSLFGYKQSKAILINKINVSLKLVFWKFRLYFIHYEPTCPSNWKLGGADPLPISKVKKSEKKKISSIKLSFSLMICSWWYTE